MKYAPANRSPEIDQMEVNEQRDLILSILCDVIKIDGASHLGEWFDHVGFDLTALREHSDLLPAWLGHYRSGRHYDIDRALSDLISWPPIAARITALSKEQGEIASARRKKDTSKKLPHDLGNSTDDL